MLKRTFKYCATHKDDEKYMQTMCEQGWAALRLVEGFWTFEPCEPNEYCYRICYLRGMKKEDFAKFKEQCANEGIMFVSRYSFWGIFRSLKPFEFYSKDEEKRICQKIYNPMPIGAIVSWLLCIGGIVLTYRVHFYWIIPTILIGIYGGMCTWLSCAYWRLLHQRKI